jgi:hypothetical protein
MKHTVTYFASQMKPIVRITDPYQQHNFGGVIGYKDGKEVSQTVEIDDDDIVFEISDGFRTILSIAVNGTLTWNPDITVSDAAKAFVEMVNLLAINSHSVPVYGIPSTRDVVPS